MTIMNTRERFVRVLTGERVDRVPFMKIFGGDNAAHPAWEQECPGVMKNIDALLGFEGTYRGWGKTPVAMDPVGFGPPRIIEETETRITRDRGDGTIEQLPKGGDYHRHVLEWPIKDRRSWEEYKVRYLDPEVPQRFPDNWSELVARYRDRDYPLQLTHGGVYGFAREVMGDENLCLAFYDNPELVHDLMTYYTDFAIALWEKQVREVEFDLIECWEDMASKNGSLISPGTFRKFLRPCYEKISAFARKHQIKIILVDSDGNVNELTADMEDSGVTTMYPYEVLAGCNLAAVLDRHPKFSAIGGLRKEAMAEGKEAINAEIAKAKLLIKKGRYIPGPDHFVLSNVTFANYRYFMEKLRDVVMTTPCGN
jgi:uroporphyrinogen decarboxylase